jgi:2-desacetyl-2-hydroxyethyl bacteriochlorophyllide A dehydrogenase
MLGLVLKDINKVELEEVEKPTIIHETDVMVKIELTTICGSDIHLIHGAIPTTPGYVLGHEYVGIVEEVGSMVKGVKEGDRVIGPAAPYCGQCEHCRQGKIAHCFNGGVHGSGKEFGNLSGTHSEYIRVPFGDVNLLPVPDDLESEQVLFVGDILSTGYFAVEKGNIKPGEDVVIFGAGPVGLCAVQCAKLFHPKSIILVDIDDHRLEVGKSLGATHILNSNEVNVLEEIAGITENKGVEVAIEAVGLEATFQQAVRSASIGGRISMVGIYGQPVNFPLQEVFMKNLKLEMGLAYLGHMKKLLDLVRIGAIDVRPLITHRISLNEIKKGIEIFEKRKDNVIKIVVRP